MSDLYLLTATEAIARIRGGECCATDLVQACSDRIRATEGGLHAWAYFDEELARRQAEAIDEEIRAGRFAGRLYGLPVGVKDIFNTRDMPTCMGSPIWDGFTPGNDARVVAVLRLEGAVIMGKTVTAEFAVHHPGPTVNPYNPEHTPGTSSSGSAVAVAAGMVPMALGTQTAGSTIRPASYCGVYGFKPSFGVLPRTGLLKTVDTLDHVTYFTRSVDDLLLFFEVMRVTGPNHPFVQATLDVETTAPPPTSWRVALVRGPVWHYAEAYAQEALASFARRLEGVPGVRVDEVDLPPEFAEAHAIHGVIYEKALSYYFQPEYAEHPDRISDVFREMVERGRRTTQAQYVAMLERQRALRVSLAEFFGSWDVVLTLATAGEAPRGLATRDKPDTCLIWTMCHVPSMSLPVFRGPCGLPFGAQVVAPRYGDYRLLRFAEHLQRNGLLASRPVVRIDTLSVLPSS